MYQTNGRCTRCSKQVENDHPRIQTYEEMWFQFCKHCWELTEGDSMHRQQCCHDWYMRKHGDRVMKPSIRPNMEDWLIVTEVDHKNKSVTVKNLKDVLDAEEFGIDLSKYPQLKAIHDQVFRKDDTMKLYEYVVMLHPTADQKKAGKITEILNESGAQLVMADSVEQVRIKASRNVQLDNPEQIDRIEVAVRPFCN